MTYRNLPTGTLPSFLNAICPDGNFEYEMNIQPNGLILLTFIERDASVQMNTRLNEIEFIGSEMMLIREYFERFINWRLNYNFIANKTQPSSLRGG